MRFYAHWDYNIAVATAEEVLIVVNGDELIVIMVLLLFSLNFLLGVNICCILL